MSCVKSHECLLIAFCTTIKQIAEYVNVQFRAKQTAIFYNWPKYITIKFDKICLSEELRLMMERLFLLEW